MIALLLSLVPGPCAFASTVSVPFVSREPGPRATAAWSSALPPSASPRRDPTPLDPASTIGSSTIGSSTIGSSTIGMSAMGNSTSRRSIPAHGSDAARETQRSDDTWTAPDGERGLPPERDTIAMFRFTKEVDEAAFLEELWSLPRGVRTTLRLCELAHRRRGDFDLIEPVPLRDLEYRGGDSLLRLARLHEGYDELAQDPSRLEPETDQLRAFVRLTLDEPFQLRGELLRGLERELDDFEGVLALLLASGRGSAALADTPEIFEAVAKRGDLAAARLRQLDHDLRLLTPSLAVETTPEHPDRAGLESSYGAGGRRAVSAKAILERAEERRRRMRANLRTPAFDEREARALDERARTLARGRDLQEELAWLVPTTPEGVAAPRDIEALRDSERYDRAITLGLRAATVDPLSPRINYLLGEALDFRHGSRSAAPYFDRFLVLDGIRYYDSTTWSELDLTAEHERALAALREF